MHGERERWERELQSSWICSFAALNGQSRWGWIRQTYESGIWLKHDKAIFHFLPESIMRGLDGKQSRQNLIRGLHRTLASIGGSIMHCAKCWLHSGFFFLHPCAICIVHMLNRWLSHFLFSSYLNMTIFCQRTIDVFEGCFLINRCHQ